jgi:predicted phosphoribosyltransferase
VVAAPTGSVETCGYFKQITDQVVGEKTPQPFYEMGMCHEDFTQIGDEPVWELLERANHMQARG